MSNWAWRGPGNTTRGHARAIEVIKQMEEVRHHRAEEKQRKQQRSTSARTTR